ncbi:MAG: SRPBCC family protein, partial [Candidatus Binatia bacterium]
MVAVATLGLVGLSGCDMIMGYFRAQRAAIKWDGPVEEIIYESLEKDGKVFDVEMHARIDAPIEKVWEAMKHPERLAEFSDQYKRSRLLSEEGNKKRLELHVLALDNLQQFQVELTFDDAAKTVLIKTIQSTLSDIEGSYKLEASPDGTKTRYIYKAKNTDKVALPVSVDVQRSALKEAFVSQVRAIKKQIGL